MATPKYRQDIKPGQSGSDVKAVKIAYKRMGINGSGSLSITKRAGPAFVKVTKTFQLHHGLKVDGVYGKATHNKLIQMKRNGKPAFTVWTAMLYRTAAIRGKSTSNATDLSAQQAAQKLLAYRANGKYHADNSGDLNDLERTAQGLPVWSQRGYWVHMDKRVLEAIVFLIERGFTIGTFAFCSDHGDDGPHGHAGGHAVDISSINGISVASSSGRAVTLEVARLLHSGMPTSLKPWQLICDGYGYQHDPEISACTIPGAYYYGYTTMSEHRNHIHLGYFG
jgi:hypothetical protein